MSKLKFCKQDFTPQVLFKTEVKSSAIFESMSNTIFPLSGTLPEEKVVSFHAPFVTSPIKLR